MKRPTFDTLRHGAPARLAALRAQLAKSLATVEKHHGKDSALYRQYVEEGIRAVRYPKDSAWTNHAPDYGGVIYADSDALDNLRELPRDDQPRDYGSGWYCDDWQHETATGCVAVLPSRKRGRRFLAYVKFSESDGLTISPHVYGDVQRAYRWAQRTAERMAEKAREECERDTAAQKASDDADDCAAKMRRLRERVVRAISIYRELPTASLNRPALLADVRELRTRFLDQLRQRKTHAAALEKLRAEGANV